MKHLILKAWLFLFLLSSCTWPASNETPISTRTSPSPTVEAIRSVSETTPTNPPLTPTPILHPEILPPFPANPPAYATETRPDLALKTWQPSGSPASASYTLPLDLKLAANPAVLDGLTADQQAFLTQNGFVVITSQEAQFNDIRENIAIRTGQPYFLSSDAAYHALHITFDEMLKALEAQYLRRQMLEITQATLHQVLADLPQALGAPIEADVQLAAAYLAVGLKLLDPEISLDSQLLAWIEPQIEQIMAGGGQAYSVLIPGFQDDYGAYKPVGHYADRPQLQTYFRGMTWFGRVHFRLQSDNPGFIPSRTPLIITQALRRASLGDRTAAQAWAELNSLLTAVLGLSDDPGPPEYAALMDQIFGADAGIQTLADADLWQRFLERKNELPSPQINSTFVSSLNLMAVEKGWRLMGQRFTLDGLIFQNLVFDKVGTQAQPRLLPNGLDLLAAYGSPLALRILEETGQTNFENYLTQMDKMQQAVQAQTVDEWLSTFYTTWLYAFFPQAGPRSTAFQALLPPFMQTEAWGYKEINSVLGSWAELKHDTVLYAKMPEAAGGGGPPMSGPAPAYIEPNPNIFYRLGYAALTIGVTLDQKINYEGIPLDEPLPDDYLPNGLNSYVVELVNLGDQLIQLGDLAAKELTGETLTPEEFDLISSCLGPIECLVFRSHTPYGIGEVKAPPMPVIAAVAGAQDQILEVAVGGLDRIYAIVPLQGSLQIAQGGVFSYYEFNQPRDERLTDEEWRVRLATNPPQAPEWRTRFALPGGSPTSVLAFRIGDIYIVTPAGNKLNVRTEPNLNAKVVIQLEPGAYLEIIDGPVNASGYTWWKLRNALDGQDLGWAVEDQTWVQRSSLLSDE